MAVINNSVDLMVDPLVAFEYLADMRHELDWNRGVVSMEKLTDGPIGEGSKFLANWKSAPRPIEVTVTSFDKPNGWVWHNGGPIEVNLTIRFEPIPGGVRMHSSFDATPHGAFKLIFPLFLRKLTREEARNMQLIKTKVESL